MEQLPQRWAIKCTEENKKALDAFYRTHIEEYKRCKPEWEIRITVYLHYPQYEAGCHSNSTEIRMGYKEITTEQFRQLVLNESFTPQIFN